MLVPIGIALWYCAVTYSTKGSSDKKGEEKMLKTGLASMTFRNKTPDEVIEITKRAGLSAIEWASDAHVPPGDTQTAKGIGKKTRESGLEVSSYGAYFRLGNGEDFAPYIESALALGTNNIRIWAGVHGSDEADKAKRTEMVLEAKRISALAANVHMNISLECHKWTLTDTLESHLRLLSEVDMPNFLTYWQTRADIAPTAQPDDLWAIMQTGRLTNIHVHSYNENGEQTLLGQGNVDWKQCLDLVRADPALHYVLIETVLGRDDESFMHDAEVLRKLVL